MSKATQDGERQPGRAAVIGCAIAFGALVLAAPGAEATYPGIPGRIAVSKPDRFANYHLATVSPRTPRLKQLTRSPRSCRSRNRTWMDDQPSYSADGRTIVYSHYDDCSSRMADGIYRMRSNGTGRKLLVRSRYTSEVEWPALSPSGRLLAWVVLTGPYEEPEGAIRVAPLRRLSDHVTLEHAGVDFQPSWSSRGRLVATAFDGVSEFSASGAQLGVVAGGAGRTGRRTGRRGAPKLPSTASSATSGGTTSMSFPPTAPASGSSPAAVTPRLRCGLPTAAPSPSFATVTETASDPSTSSRSPVERLACSSATWTPSGSAGNRCRSAARTRPSDRSQVSVRHHATRESALDQPGTLFVLRQPRHPELLEERAHVLLHRVHAEKEL
jgi:hypothetical protein